MINREVILTARQLTGRYLRQIREEKGVKKHHVTKLAGLTYEQIQAIETGSSAYTIDSFLSYIQALDCYFFLGNKEGEHLNLPHMLDKMNEKEPPLS